MTRTELEQLTDVELLKLGEIKGAESTLLVLNYKRANKERLEELTILANLVGEIGVERGLLDHKGKWTEKGKSAKSLLETEKRANTSHNSIAQNNHSDKNSGSMSRILWGVVLCAGGIIATVADFGFIFYGAIIYGGIQLIFGLIDYNKN